MNRQKTEPRGEQEGKEKLFQQMLEPILCVSYCIQRGGGALQTLSVKMSFAVSFFSSAFCLL